MSAVTEGKAQRAAKDAPVTPEDDVEMGFFEHLGELRKRIIRALLAVIPAMGLCWIYVDELLGFLLAPLTEAYESQGLPSQVHFANPVDPLVAKMKVAAIFGAMLAAPWIFYQIWAFVSPGLYRKERYLAIPFVIFSTLFFVGGAYFGYMVVFPRAFETLLSFGGSLPGGGDLTPTLMIADVLSFITRMLLAFGAVFEVPVIVTFLAAAEIVDWRQLMAFGRWFVVVASIIAAILTPPDVISQTMMLGPLVALYALSVGIAWFIAFTRGQTGKKKSPAAE